jgi:hypothetical protein
MWQRLFSCVSILQEEINDESNLQAFPEAVDYYKIFATERTLS